jgi:hypothetical protein
MTAQETYQRNEASQEQVGKNPESVNDAIKRKGTSSAHDNSKQRQKKLRGNR